MLRWSQKHPWLVSLTVIAALLVLLFFGSLFIQLTGNLCEYSEQAHKTECANHHIGPFALLWIIEIIDSHNGFVTAIATLVMAGFTGTLWWTSAEQGQIAQTSINLAREEFIASHYPRIILREVDVIENRIHYTLVNTGAQATLVESWITSEGVAPGVVPRNLRPFGHDDLGRLIFAHGERKFLDIGEGDAGFFMRFPAAKRIVIEGQVSVGDIYFVGALCYEDALGNRRNSFFRRRWNPDSERFERTENPDHEYAD